MGIKHGEVDLLIGREALNTQRPEKNLAACPVERGQQEMERIILSTAARPQALGRSLRQFAPARLHVQRTPKGL